MTKIQLREVKKGDYLRRSETSVATYVKGDYDRPSRSFECHDFGDVNKTIYIKTNK